METWIPENLESVSADAGALDHWRPEPSPRAPKPSYFTSTGFLTQGNAVDVQAQIYCWESIAVKTMKSLVDQNMKKFNNRKN